MTKKQQGARFDYRAAPPAGTMLTWLTHVYVLDHSKPYTRKDGRGSSILTWATACSRCGKRVLFQTGLSGRCSRTKCGACAVAARRKRYAKLRELKSVEPDPRRQRYQTLRKRKGQLEAGQPMSRYARHKPPSDNYG